MLWLFNLHKKTSTNDVKDVTATKMAKITRDKAMYHTAMAFE